VEEQPVYLLDA